MDLKLTGKILLVTGSTAAKYGMLTKCCSRHKARVWTEAYCSSVAQESPSARPELRLWTNTHRAKVGL